MKRISKLFLLMFSLCAFTTSVYALDIDGEQPPDGYYLVISDDSIESTGGDIKSIKTILEAKKKSVAEEVYQALAKRDGAGVIVSGDLEGTQKYSNVFLWGINVNYGDNTSETGFIVREGKKGTGVAYNIFVPQGKIKVEILEKSHYVGANQQYFKFLNNFIVEYKKAVKEGVLAGSVKAGFNIFEPYSTKQLYLDKVTKLEEGTYVFDKTGDVAYTFAYFYSPIFGKLLTDNAPKTTQDWSSYTTADGKTVNYINEVGNKMVVNKSTKEVSVQVDPGYLDFIQGNAPECESIKETSSDDLIKAKGVEAYSLAGASYKPFSAVNYMLDVALPLKFKRVKPDIYGLDEESFSLVEGIKLSISKNYVYLTQDKATQVSEEKEDEVDGEANAAIDGTDPTEATEPKKEASIDGKVYIKDGSFEDYNISRGRLALYSLKQASGAVKGVLVPLKYLEAVYDTTDNTYYSTGRMLEFMENYTKNLKYVLPNTGMFNIVTNAGGSEGAVLRNYAFKVDSNDSTFSESYKTAQGHVLSDDSPSDFKIQLGFSSDPNKGKGFLMYRNNTYLQDSSLIAWLKTSNANSLTWVEAEELLKKITGVYELGESYLSYEDWLRMQEIADNLSFTNKNFLVRIINVSSTVIGVCMALYSWFLIFAYYFDIFNVFFDDFSLIQLMTGGRYFPVATKEERDFLRQSSSASDVKYVFIHNIIILTLIGCSISLLFIQSELIVGFIVNVWLFLNYRMGGM